jgi:hypothetical protein
MDEKQNPQGVLPCGFASERKEEKMKKEEK